MPSARKLHPSRHHIISFANLLKRLCTLRYPQANLAYQLTSLLVNFLPAMFVIHDGNLPLVLRLLNPLHNSLLLSSIFMNHQEPIYAMRNLPLVMSLLHPLHNSLLLSSIFMNQQEPIEAMRDLP